MAARSIHDAFEQAVRQEIEIEREFCIFPRSVKTKGGRGVFTGKELVKISDLGNELPLEFIVSVKVQRENRFSVAAHNELMLTMLKAGMITPDVALEMMNFDGKEQVQSLMAKKLEEARAQQQEAEEKKQQEQEQKAEKEKQSSQTPIADEMAAKKEKTGA